MGKRIENFLKNLSIEELREVRNMASELIHDYVDGFQYECKVRSYGRNWTERPTNVYSVEELCFEYSGEDGIVDIYTTNPDLIIENYGNTYYFPTLEDAERWRNHTYLVNSIPHWKEELDNWDNRDKVPFRYRPTFEPYITRERIANYELEIAQNESSIVQPVRLKTYQDQEE
jgi:hypothetical protein